jgi:hypothetical protein
MKSMRRIVAVALIALVLVTVTAPASALSGYGVEFSAAAWDIPCGSGGGYLTFYTEFNVPKGYLVKNWYHLDGSDGITYESSGEWSYGSTSFGTWGAPIAANGYFHLIYNVFNPDGSFISHTEVYGSCPSGEAWTTNDPGIQQPAADQRASGYVLADTPLYTQADPSTARSETLKTGQTWFIVGSAIGTDGNLWYEVFVGGVNTAYVPAAVIRITEGTVP